MPNEPLIFLEAALVNGMAANVQTLLDESAPREDPREADTAVFYSISNAQKGLVGVSFGGFLIKRVEDDLAHEFLAASRTYEESLAQVKAKLYGSTFAIARSWPSIWAEVRHEFDVVCGLERRLPGAEIHQVTASTITGRLLVAFRPDLPVSEIGKIIEAALTVEALQANGTAPESEWHLQDAEEVCETLQTSASGLSNEEAGKRLQRDGFLRRDVQRMVNQGRNVFGADVPFGDGAFSQSDFDDLAGAGANYVHISHAGLFSEDPPYALDTAAQSNLDTVLNMARNAGLFAGIAFRTGPGRNDLSIVDAASPRCSIVER